MKGRRANATAGLFLARVVRQQKCVGLLKKPGRVVMHQKVLAGLRHLDAVLQQLGVLRREDGTRRGQGGAIAKAV